MQNELPAETMIAQRFVIKRLAGQGGMSSVYQAVDTLQGGQVALKILHHRGARSDERFAREARVLAELTHPNIVRYLASGQTSDGQLYIAMEWLDGEDLGQRLRRGPLPLPETLLFMRKVGEALAAAHRRQIVHRDLKPSNIFLRDGEPGQVALLDFGIARPRARTSGLTRSGVLLGTPTYMAPEQVRGDRDIKPAADIFALGCILYHCLTGQLPFAADHMVATLTRILFEDPFPLTTLNPALPPALDALLASMLDKEPTQRIADAGVFLDKLADLSAAGVLGAPSRKLPVGYGVVSGQHLVSVLVAVPRRKGISSGAISPLATGERAENTPPAEIDALREALHELRAYVERLPDGSLVVTLHDARQSVEWSATASDQAYRIARCALIIKERWPEASIAIGTGRGLRQARLLHGSGAAEQLPVGEAIDRACKLLSGRPHEGPGHGILVDEVTAGLIDSRYHVNAQPSGLYTMSGEEIDVDTNRLLLGKPTPCVGREQELGFLEQLYRAAMSESRATCALITALPGVGKSRLRHELLRRLGIPRDDLPVLLGNGDPMNAGATYGVLRKALRRLCSVRDGEPLATQRRKLERLGAALPPNQKQRVIEFLGELCEVLFPVEESEKLATARGDPLVMRTEIREALIDFLRAETLQKPLLLVLEDLHWGDALSVKLLEDALRELSDRPLMILALARPSINELFPQLWDKRVQRLPLRPLGKRASERLVQEMLGAKATPATVARIIDQAGGNALFLEELIRAVADGHGDALPETVLAMLQARLSSLDPEARRLLRAASVYGEHFRPSGVAALLQDGTPIDKLTRACEELVHQELLGRRDSTELDGELEYRFRHALTRDAAYSLLTEEVRTLSHRLAARYLEQNAPSEVLPIAEHYVRGQEPARAVHYYAAAAEAAFNACDGAAALTHVDSALRCGAEKSELGELRRIQALTHFYRRDFAVAYPAAAEARSLLREGSAGWFQVTTLLLSMTTLRGQKELRETLSTRLRTIAPEAEARLVYADAISQLLSSLCFQGQSAEARALLREKEALLQQIAEGSDRALGYLTLARHSYYSFVEANPWADECVTKEGAEAWARAGARRGQALMLVLHGIVRMWHGDLRGGETVVLRGQELSEQIHEAFLISHATSFRCFLQAACEEGPPSPELCALTEAGYQSAAQRSDDQHAGLSRYALACVRFRQGNLDAAERIAKEALLTTGLAQAQRVLVYATLTEIILCQGRLAEARTVGEEGLRLLNGLDGHPRFELRLHLALVKARAATGALASAKELLRTSCQELRRRVETFPEHLVAARARYLHRVIDHVQIMELAQKWEVDDALT